MSDMLPFAPSCENNKRVILEVLQQVFADSRAILELASGTGQHATWFAEHLSHLCWQPTELARNIAQLSPRCAAYSGDNLLTPLPLDVRSAPWALAVQPDGVFTANSLHIMAWAAVEELFAQLPVQVNADAVLAIYGPFNYGGEYTCESNARFDEWLAERDPSSAIRDFEAVDALAATAGFQLSEDNEMPANNRLLVWRRAEL